MMSGKLLKRGGDDREASNASLEGGRKEGGILTMTLLCLRVAAGTRGEDRFFFSFYIPKRGAKTREAIEKDNCVKC